LQNLGTLTYFWPAFLPNLNPIKLFWDLFKNWIAYNYVIKDLKDYKVLRKALKKAWNAITKKQLDYLFNSMHERCQAVIAANNKKTKY